MFDGEFSGLLKIYETGVVKVPKPVTVFDHAQECFLVMEYLELKALSTQAASKCMIFSIAKFSQFVQFNSSRVSVKFNCGLLLENYSLTSPVVFRKTIFSHVSAHLFPQQGISPTSKQLKNLISRLGLPDVFCKNTGFFVNSDKNIIIEKNNRNKA